MRKFYTLLALLSVAVISVSAQSIKVHKKNDVKVLSERQKKTLEVKKNIATLRSAKQQSQTFEPDSAYAYSGTGELIYKRFYTFADNGRDISWDEFEKDEKNGKFFLASKMREITDANGNELLWEEIYRDSSNDEWRGDKGEYTFDDSNKEIASKSYRWYADSTNWFPTYSRLENPISEGGLEKINEYFNYDSVMKISERRKNVVTLDKNGLEVFEHQYLWDIASGKWVNYEMLWNPEAEKWEKSYFSYSEWVYTYAANGKPETKIRYRVSPNSTEEKYPEEKSEYKYVGNNVSQEIVYMGDYVWNGEEGEWIWRNNQKNVYGYDPQNNQILNESYYWNDPWDGSGNGVWQKGNKEISEYDSRGNLTLSLNYWGEYESNVWIDSYKYEMKYDDQDREVYTARYRAILDSVSGQYSWVGDYRSIESFSAEGYGLYYEEQEWDYRTNSWGFGSKDVLEVDSKGKPTLFKEYVWEDGQWMIDEYTIFFPYTPENDVVVEESKPINDDNEWDTFEGKFTLGLNIASNAIPTGTFEINLPQGFSLDEDATTLSEALSGKVSLSLEQDATNPSKWKATITASNLRSAGDVVYKNIVDIAYKVEESVASKQSEIVLSTLNFSLSTGGAVVKDELKVQVAPKNVSNIENEEAADRIVTLERGILSVNTSDAERIDVYTATGAQILSVEKLVGEFTTSIDVDGLVIVKGSTGWIQKLIAR